MKQHKPEKTFLLILILAALLATTACSKTPAAQASLDKGIAYLEAQEKKDPADVDAAIQVIEQQRLEAQREELLQSLISGEKDVWGMFQNAVILGDSRAVGFSYYGFLSDEQVFATSGERITQVPEHYDEIRAANPSYIYLCYGLNDIIFWDGAEAYAEGYAEVVEELQAEFPNATIIVSSIIAIYDPAFEKESDWYQLPEYSAAVERYCNENGIAFANTDDLCAEHSDLWQPDGIHLMPDFYHYWASNLILTMLEGAGQVTEG